MHARKRKPNNKRNNSSMKLTGSMGLTVRTHSTISSKILATQTEVEGCGGGFSLVNEFLRRCLGEFCGLKADAPKGRQRTGGMATIRDHATHRMIATKWAIWRAAHPHYSWCIFQRHCLFSNLGVRRHWPRSLIYADPPKRIESIISVVFR